MLEHKIVKLYLKKPVTIFVLFSDGKFKKYDLKILFNDYPRYRALLNYELFSNYSVLAGVFIKWNDDLDLMAHTIYQDGTDVKPFEPTTLLLLGFRIKQVRLESNMSQQRLSKLSGIDQSEISRLENGQINPSIEYIEKITKVLKKKLDIKII